MSEKDDTLYFILLSIGEMENVESCVEKNWPNAFEILGFTFLCQTVFARIYIFFKV